MTNNKLLIFLIVAVLCSATGTYSASFDLKVNLSDSLRPVTHCATGALYGITETLPQDITGLVTPLKPCMYTQPARAGNGRQQPIGAAITVSERLKATTGTVTIRLADICPGWPYQWPGQSSWITEVTSVINDKKTSGSDNYYGYEIWNEPNGTWTASNGNFNTACWKPTYDLIRQKDPGAKIIGPSDAYYVKSRLTDFLTFCKNNSCLPDIICWHELQGSANISSHISDYRSIEKSLGIMPLAISINEYCHNTHDYEGCPGTSAPFIAKFERNNVQSASISWWFTDLPGRSGSLLTSSNSKGGGWWFYKWYADMTGFMTKVTPPNDASEGIDGFACLDTVNRYASICMGGNNAGTVNVIISGIPSSFGSSIDTKVECIEWKNKDTPVSGPTTIAEKAYDVSDGSLIVPVNVTSQFYGYRVYLSSKPAAVTETTRRSSVTTNEITIHVDPATHLMSMTWPGNSSGSTDIVVFTPSGTVMQRVKAPGSNFKIGNLASGVYFINIKRNHQSFIMIQSVMYSK